MANAHSEFVTIDGCNVRRFREHYLLHLYHTGDVPGYHMPSPGTS